MTSEPLTSRDYAGSLHHDVTEADLLRLEPDERLWKLWVFRPAAGRATRLEHRIYSKQKPNGQLAMITFAMHTPNGEQAARSNIARVPDIAPKDLEHIIESIRQQTQGAGDDYEEIDLSGMATLDEQLAHLQHRE
jgi:hypothetical protein